MKQTQQTVTAKGNAPLISNERRSKILHGNWSRRDAIRAKRFQARRDAMIAKFRASGRTYSHAEAVAIVEAHKGQGAKTFKRDFEMRYGISPETKPETAPEITPEIHALLMRDSLQYREAHQEHDSTDEHERWENEGGNFADSYYSLRDAGRNPDGSGESYAERNH